MIWRLLLQLGAASSTASTTARRVAFLPEQHTDFIFSAQPDGFSSLWLVLAAMFVAVLWILRRRRRRIPRDNDIG